MKRTLAIIALGALIGVRPASGQVLRGIVRDSTSQLAIAGAVVTTYDSAGRVGRRSLTDERGAYFVTAPAAARRVRVVRLGFRPVDLDVPSQRDSVLQLDVVMMRIPYALQPVRVMSGANCPRRSDRATALALLEEARAGLLATVVARTEKPARMKRLLIDRRLDATSNAVVRHRVEVQTVPSTVAAFGAALPAARFASEGFATDSGGGAMFHAPDADVLLDDAFAAAYCFHVVGRDRTRPNQVGLGFRAASRRQGRIDVDGTLWVDTVARALVDIEYRYVGLHPTVTFLQPGGRVSFQALPNGVVLIDRWVLRLVGVEPDTARRPLDPVGRFRELGRPVDERYVVGEVGGELARVTFDDGYTWAASLGTLSLTVTSDRGTPTPGVIVNLDDTNYEATTDSAGRLEIPDLVPGAYAALITDARLDAIDVSRATPLSFTAERSRTASLTLRATSAEDFVADRCLENRQPGFNGERPPLPGSGFVIGRVFSPTREPVGGVRWAMRIHVDERPSDPLAGPDTGSDGVFVYCGLPVGADITFSFSKQGMVSGSIGRRIKDPLTVVSVQMDPEKKRK
jgi:hypothetical protein